jgi:hypothetical protein
VIGRDEVKEQKITRTGLRATSRNELRGAFGAARDRARGLGQGIAGRPG